MVWLPSVPVGPSARAACPGASGGRRASAPVAGRGGCPLSSPRRVLRGGAGRALGGQSAEGSVLSFFTLLAGDDPAAACPGLVVD